MKKEAKTGQEIDNILNSLDNVKRAEVPAFFYTRLIARMEREKQPVNNGLLRVFARPVVGISVLVLFLVLNIVAIKGIMSPAKTPQGGLTDAQSFATEYNLNTTASGYSN